MMGFIVTWKEEPGFHEVAKSIKSTLRALWGYPYGSHATEPRCFGSIPEDSRQPGHPFSI